MCLSNTQVVLDTFVVNVVLDRSLSLVRAAVAAAKPLLFL